MSIGYRVSLAKQNGFTPVEGRQRQNMILLSKNEVELQFHLEKRQTYVKNCPEMIAEEYDLKPEKQGGKALFIPMGAEAAFRDILQYT